MTSRLRPRNPPTSASRWARRTRHCTPPPASASLPDQAKTADSEKDAVLLEAWLNQRTEWSKSLFTIASAAVALIVTALLGKDNGLQPHTLAFLVLSGLCFVASTLACVAAFDASADAIKEVLNPSEAESRPKHAEPPEDALKRLASIQRGGFQFGILLLIVAAFLQVAIK